MIHLDMKEIDQVYLCFISFQVYLLRTYATSVTPKQEFAQSINATEQEFGEDVFILTQVVKVSVCECSFLISVEEHTHFLQFSVKMAASYALRILPLRLRSCCNGGCLRFINCSTKWENRKQGLQPVA